MIKSRFLPLKRLSLIDFGKRQLSIIVDEIKKSETIADLTFYLLAFLGRPRVATAVEKAQMVTCRKVIDNVSQLSKRKVKEE